ncbi:pentatricopeptide repeat-containing protein [Panicum miliaceum]|uniref:Pentatricopeptide repeat-containing protein n=1 Tax=Panicum miliaceum TaxID=4540 RepID=A0A3L6S260_PANMI|nr:pentatricopeptide repeat-containing protein [Panicum miliaceum]
MARLPPVPRPAAAAAAVASTSTQDIVAKLGHIISTRRWNKGTAYKRLAPSVTAAHVAEVFRAPPAPLHPATALAYFEWVERRPGFRHTAASHAALLQLLARRRAPANYDKLVVSMIKCSDTAEDMREAVDAIQAIGRTGGARLALSPKCYNFALRSLSRFDMTEHMGKVYSQLVQDGLLPDAVTYNTMIMAYCKEGSLAIAHQYFRLLRESGMELDTFTCNQLLLGYCRKGDLGKACWLLLMMPLMGCARNEYSYTIVIQGLCQARSVWEALVLLLMMRQDGCSPNVRTYTLLIKGLCKEGRIDDARMLLDEMPQRGVVPSVWTYNAMIDGYCKLGRTKDALGIKSLMEGNGCDPDDWTYNSLIHGLCDGKTDEAEELLNSATARGFTPTVVTFTNMINGYCKAGRIDDALRVKNIMMSSNEPKLNILKAAISSWTSDIMLMLRLCTEEV